MEVLAHSKRESDSRVGPVHSGDPRGAPREAPRIDLHSQAALSVAFGAD